MILSKRTKRILLGGGLITMMLLLAACGTSTVTQSSTNWWDRYVIYNAALFILWLAKLFGGNPGVGIIVFTLLIRVVIFPLSYMQIKSMGKQQELAPQLKELQKQYSSKDTETQRKLQEATQKLYADNGINPLMGCLPLLVQMPFLFALYQAIARTDALKQGTFLWMNLAKPDPLFILPILAAIFTALTTLTSTLAQPQRTATSWIMVAVSPIMILAIAFTMPSAISIYWVVTNAFSLAQTFLIQNPFKLKRERDAKAAAEKARQKALRKAYKRALKK
ncbi:preprotein translocase subunit YidC [Lacticaseibacillus nasuensis JCM 17158]|uniref:Membrane protein insertase YidC n=1 Tax=Lacticaseibacillus nasuensis JCM 17158 TaxID=1291734 RepID=A0A0R1JRG4_9LACO|nr:preprotein translocase subunit YidC [Lacticaseibacillus nasuensis JCM 17158]